MEEGVIVPRFSHRALLEPSLRRMRALLALMTAAKALSTVHEWFATTEQKSQEVGFRLEMADLWATGEAAASLGFFAARLSDKLDEAEHPSSSDAKLAALFSPAAKLFSSSSIPKCLQQMAKWDEYSVQDANDMRTRLVDAQIEDMYMGPAALQRRLVSAAMTDTHFLAEFQKWTGEIDALAARMPRAGMRSLAEGMRLWQWTLEQLRQQVDARGVRLFCDARQGVTFAMAEALCGLLAAHSLALDVLEMDRNPQGGEFAALFGDLSILAAGRSAAHASQTCTEVFGGYAERFPISAAARGVFARQRASLCANLEGMMDARERIAEFLRASRLYGT
jgi:hypothetical protein